ncbi:MAG: transporter [Proteobacteria bacterium]|nr:MAG: transporter [Pseudomonadota bacterium]PIE18997.1 MAG: transporter [Pseudomonadota bacterium]
MSAPISSLRASSAMSRVRTSPWVRLSAKVLLSGLVITFMGLAVLPWQQSSRGEGRVIAYSPVERQQVVQAPIGGRIVRWLVQEGTEVSAGQALVDLADNDPAILDRLRAEREAVKARLKAKEISIEALDSQVQALTSARKLSLKAAAAKIRMAKNKLRAAHQVERAAKATQLTSKLNLGRQKALESRGLTSRRRVELAELSYAKAKANVFKAKAKVAELQSDVLAQKANREKGGADLDAKIAKARAEAQKLRAGAAKAQADYAKVSVRLTRQSAMRVEAPRAGTIVRVIARGGEFVKPGVPLAILVPSAGARAVEIWIDGNDAPLVTPGRQVRLQFEGWPAVQFSGWPAVSVGTFGGTVAFIDAAANDDGKFRVVVRPNGEAWPGRRYLRQGARVNAWILLEQVTLGYELWRQLNGFPPRTKKPPEVGAAQQKASKSGSSDDEGKEKKK